MDGKKKFIIKIIGFIILKGVLNDNSYIMGTYEISNKAGENIFNLISLREYPWR